MLWTGSLFKGCLTPSLVIVLIIVYKIQSGGVYSVSAHFLTFYHSSVEILIELVARVDTVRNIQRFTSWQEFDSSIWKMAKLSRVKCNRDLGLVYIKGRVVLYQHWSDVEAFRKWPVCKSCYCTVPWLEYRTSLMQYLYSILYIFIES